MNKHQATWTAITLTLATTVHAEKLPVGLEGWHPAPGMSAAAAAQKAGESDNGSAAIHFDFAQTESERHLVAWEAKLAHTPEKPKALAVRLKLNLSAGSGLRLAAVFYDTSGNAWFARGAETLPANEWSEQRLAVLAPKAAEFNADMGKAFSWGDVHHMWLGVICEGPARGSLSVSSVQFTDEPYRASKPLKLTTGNKANWNVGQDPAVESNLSGDGAANAMRFQFKFPGGRHMYAIPGLSVPTADLEAYQSLQFTYRAKLPAGLPGLLISLQERDGGQYYLDPLPPASEEWKNITIPLSSFKLAPWSKDPNNRLDLDGIGTVQIGTHGSASGNGGSGTIEVKDVQFVP